jgi:RNA polymerase sigma factor (sigma-70 family)
MGGPVSTNRLLAAARDADSSAIGALFRRHFSWLSRWASGRLPSYARDELDTADLVQDTLLAAFARLAWFSPRHTGAFRAYLRRSIQNRVCDEIRRANRQRRCRDLELDDIPSPACSPLDDLLDSETRARFSSALAALARRDQMAVVARCEMQYSYEQISEALGIRSPEAARKVVARALKRVAGEMSRVGA